MTLRSICNSIVTVLKSKAAEIGVDADSIILGVFGSTPAVSPYIMVFALPGDPFTEDGSPKSPYLADVNIQSGTEAADGATASFDALEIVERAARVINKSVDIMKYLNSNPAFGYGISAKNSNKGTALLSYDIVYTPAELIVPEGE